MSYTTDLLDAAKLAQGIDSDYRLAQVLGVGRTTVSNWRVGRTFPMHTTTCELARMAGRDAGAALVGVGTDRLSQPEQAQNVASLRALMAPAIAAETARSG